MLNEMLDQLIKEHGANAVVSALKENAQVNYGICEYRIERKAEVLYILGREDADYIAGRTLTDDELESIARGCSWGFGECWETILRAAMEDLE